MASCPRCGSYLVGKEPCPLCTRYGPAPGPAQQAWQPPTGSYQPVQFSEAWTRHVPGAYAQVSRADIGLANRRVIRASVTTMILALINLVVGMILAGLAQNDVMRYILDAIGLDWRIITGVGVLYAILGLVTLFRRRSYVAPAIALLLFGLDSLLWIAGSLFGLSLVASIANQYGLDTANTVSNAVGRLVVPFALRALVVYLQFRGLSSVAVLKLARSNEQSRSAQAA